MAPALTTDHQVSEPKHPQKSLDRPSAEEIFAQVAKNARAELRRSTLSLAVSGFTGGIFMGLSALGVALLLAMLGDTPRTEVLARMFYPLGFITVILGRSQLFTENTLYPVALVLAERRHVGRTARLWATVLPANIAGALTFAALVSLTGGLRPEVLAAIVKLGREAVERTPGSIFWSGVMAGWIIALAAWLVSGSHSISGSVMVIWILTFLVGLGGFAHCIVTSGEVFTAILRHALPWSAYLPWFGLAVLGNIVGGVGMVTLLEYGQVMDDRQSGARKGAALQ